RAMEEAARAGAAAMVPGREVAEAFRPFDLTDPFGFYARARDEAPIFGIGVAHVPFGGRIDGRSCQHHSPAAVSPSHIHTPARKAGSSR
ncbi:MAG: hypothetical protein ACXVYW_19210, partial [Oryzihumus sp.]